MTSEPAAGGTAAGTARTAPSAGPDLPDQPDVASPAKLAALLEDIGYLADDGVATAAFLSLRMGKPLFCEGEPGTGKTSLAVALSESLDLPLVRLQCHEGIDAAQALYEWDFPRQLLHLRALEAAEGGRLNVDDAEESLYTERFLLARPLLTALRSSPCVLLVDEIDRADDEFEAFLLQLLDENTVTIPEYGEVRAERPPLVVLTSNRTREVHDALKRRCLYHWLEHPDLSREIAILRARVPGIGQRLAEQIAETLQRLRTMELLKPPGVAEALDWANALRALGRDELDAASAASTLGAVLKFSEDLDRVRARLDAVLG
ncbi:MoxR family ATPase [Prauserella halophila]|uniref:MoxR family ATPase n=1 Tax=Prauserella halophila TaxID=185641 RepID=A0ABP4GFF3_9PSEU|nr:MoxR-like ATPase [Prauserella halophila]